MKKTICFISIFELTKVFYEISIVLEKQGHRCIWITTNKKYTSWLLEKGVKKEFKVKFINPGDPVDAFFECFELCL